MQAIILVIDSLGIGELPDAHEYGDKGSNTLGHIYDAIPNASLPHLEKMGIKKALQLTSPNTSTDSESLKGSYGVMRELSPGKDTTTGHWELGGIILEKAFQTFPPASPSFPDALIKNFCQKINKGILGNEAASGTEIIMRLGSEHLQTGKPIVYTSADSVFQIAAHEEIIPITELYDMCETARELCNPYQIARVIARPFIGSPGKFERTARRKDFSIPLPQKSILDHLKQNGVKTIGVGKIGNIFNEQGLTETFPEKGNQKCLEKTLHLLNHKSKTPTFTFVNLVDTDMIYGHRRDVNGYYQELQHIDSYIPKIKKLLAPDDLLIITADHGCDPTFRGTDHTREYVPLLVYQKTQPPANLGVRKTFADVAQSLTQFFNTPPMPHGESFLK